VIFILGGRGFLGAAFVRTCTARGLEHAVITRETYAAHTGRACSILINAAGNSKKYMAQQTPLADFDASVRTVRASLEDFGYDRYVLISSSDVYPDATSPQTTREDQALDPARQTAYGFHKGLAEACVRHRARQWLILRGGGFVGPGLRKNAIYDILHGGPLWLDAGSELQYLNADAAASIALDLVAAGVSREVVNWSATGVVALRDVIALAGRDVPVQPGSPRIRCEINLEKLASWVPVPDTRATVTGFVRDALAAGRR
jgi:nucleoside-diphosphate-sugar epimerase